MWPQKRSEENIEKILGGTDLFTIELSETKVSWNELENILKIIQKNGIAIKIIQIYETRMAEKFGIWGNGIGGIFVI